MKDLKIDEKWSVQYDENNNDRPVKWFRYDTPMGLSPSNNLTVALFYSLLEARTEIARLQAALASSEEARRAERAAVVRECAEIAYQCQRQNGPLAKKGFEEKYRAGLEAAGQAIASGILALATPTDTTDKGKANDPQSPG